MHALKPMRHAVEDQEEIAPRHQLSIPVQVHPRLFHAADEKLFHAHFPRNLLERLFRVANGKRHQYRARPGRNFVDVEPEPVGKQHDLRRNRGDRIVVILSEEAEIYLGERVDFGDAAQIKNLFAGASQGGMIGTVAREL